MNILVDTDVWSEAFRKRAGEPSPYVHELTHLIQEGRVQLVGFIRMEILCGIRNVSLFNSIQDKLSAFPDKLLDSNIFVQAARLFNLCRSNGIQGSNNDFLLCACAITWDLPILSKDKDYLLYQKYIPIELLKPRI